MSRGKWIVGTVKESKMPRKLVLKVPLDISMGALWTSQGVRENTPLLLFPLADVNRSWTNARSDFSEVSSQAACR